eukprot:366110-Chlamydomonas_euryale.AAC.6
MRSERPHFTDKFWSGPGTTARTPSTLLPLAHILTEADMPAPQTVLLRPPLANTPNPVSLGWSRNNESKGLNVDCTKPSQTPIGWPQTEGAARVRQTALVPPHPAPAAAYQPYFVTDCCTGHRHASPPPPPALSAYRRRAECDKDLPADYPAAHINCLAAMERGSENPAQRPYLPGLLGQGAGIQMRAASRACLNNLMHDGTGLKGSSVLAQEPRDWGRCQALCPRFSHQCEMECDSSDSTTLSATIWPIQLTSDCVKGTNVRLRHLNAIVAASRPATPPASIGAEGCEAKERELAQQERRRMRIGGENGANPEKSEGRTGTV